MGSLSIFDIIGPVMVGPSSSHTAGAAKIGLELFKRMHGRLISAQITLYNSFADTGVGHGTRMAIAGGLLGLDTFDTKLKESFGICRQMGISLEFSNAYDSQKHPNSVFIRATTTRGCFCGFGESLGGGLADFRLISSEVGLNGFAAVGSGRGKAHMAGNA